MFTTREAEREIVRSLAPKLRQKAWRMFFPLSGLVNNCPLFLYTAFNLVRSYIHERTTLLRFRGIILRVIRLEVAVYNVYIKNQFQTAFNQGGGGWVKYAWSKMEQSSVCSPACSSLLATCVMFWSHRRRVVEYTAVMFSPERMYVTLDSTIIAVYARHILAWRGSNVYWDLVKLLVFMSWVYFFFQTNFSLLITDSKVELQKSLQCSYIYLCLYLCL